MVLTKCVFSKIVFGGKHHFIVLQQNTASAAKTVYVEKNRKFMKIVGCV